MGKSPWVTALWLGLYLAGMSLVMGWAAGSRLRQRPPGEQGRLRHPRSTLLVGAFGFLLFFGIAAASRIFGGSEIPWWTTVMFLSFALLSSWMIVDYLKVDYSVDQEGLSYMTFLYERKRLRWSEVARARYGESMKWFVLETRAGETARVSAMYMGLDELARLVLDKVPGESIDPDSRAVFERAAKGELPSIWQ